jgi:hypothetical protein|uniref:Uncharacterized protein n=1 Tax=Zea mays TaxID=4577 RepID=B4FJ32_MAIZE|nr:unknown [Zea mays]
MAGPLLLSSRRPFFLLLHGSKHLPWTRAPNHGAPIPSSPYLELPMAPPSLPLVVASSAPCSTTPRFFSRELFPHGATPCLHSSLAPRKIADQRPCSSSIYCAAALTSRGKPAGFLPPASRFCSLHASSLRGALAAARPDHISMAKQPPCSELLLFPRCAAPRRNATVPAATTSKFLRPALRSKNSSPAQSPFPCSFPMCAGCSTNCAAASTAPRAAGLLFCCAVSSTP